jgi:RNA polymerase sigma-70 factor (ECF subfamily)
MDFAKLYQEHRVALYAFAFRVLNHREDAEDVIHDLFMKLGQNPELLDHVEKPREYLLTTLHHIMCNFLQSKKSRRDREERYCEWIKMTADPTNDEATTAALQKANLAIETLPPDQREVIFLHIFEGYSFAKIAQVLGISQNTVSSRFRYALDKIHNRLCLL